MSCAYRERFMAICLLAYFWLVQNSAKQWIVIADLTMRPNRFAGFGQITAPELLRLAG